MKTLHYLVTNVPREELCLIGYLAVKTMISKKDQNKDGYMH